MEERGEDLRHVLAVPGEGHLVLVRLLGQLLERLAPGEVVVELHERTVAQVVRSRVVVLDPVRHEAAGDGTGGLVAVGRQPLAILLHALAAVHGRQRGGNPAGLQGVGGVGARTDRRQAELAARFHDDVEDLFVVGVWAPDLKSRRAGHAVAQRLDLLAAQIDVAPVEELDFLRSGRR